MTKYRILLVEELVLSDSAEFFVESDTPAGAAAILIKARQAGLDEDTDTVHLPDGQRAQITPQNIVESRLFCVLLDDAGNQIVEIPTDPDLRAKKAPQPVAPRAPDENVGDAQWIYDPREWDCTYSWRDRGQLAEAADLALGEIREFASLIDGPLIHAARIPTAFDEDGLPEETEVQWFRSRSEAQSSLAVAWGKSPNSEYAIPSLSPWGPIETLRFIAPGIYAASTPNHGGIHLSPTLNADMPDDMRSANGWYEEDSKWSFVALKYPAPFRAQTGVDPRHPLKTAYECALECARHWYPDIVARFLNDDAARRADASEPGDHQPSTPA
jgi:hypothetical protein